MLRITRSSQEEHVLPRFVGLVGVGLPTPKICLHIHSVSSFIQALKKYQNCENFRSETASTMYIAFTSGNNRDML
jgi:hypothetical protein